MFEVLRLGGVCMTQVMLSTLTCLLLLLLMYSRIEDEQPVIGGARPLGSDTSGTGRVGC